MTWKSAALLTLSIFGVGSLVYFLLKQDEESSDFLLMKSPKKTVAEIKIPIESIGIVIGRGGNTIREIESKADVKLNIQEDNNGNRNYKICTIKGSPEAVQYAESLIHEVIVSQPLIEMHQMLIPTPVIGRIIGKNGDNIRLISRNSNAKIIIENLTSDNLEKKITIKGTSEQIALAKALIEQKIEEDLEFRNKVESQVARRSPRSKPKYLLPAKAESEEADSKSHKEKFIATGSNGLLEVYVSAIESPDRFWVQMVNPSTVELDRLIEQMTEYYEKAENKERHKLRELKIGQIVAAPFTFDEKWYRAEVLEVPGESDEADVQLYYVDYGDSSHCKKNNVYELRTDFLRLRFQAIECMLAKIKPRDSTWSEEATEFLEDLAHVAMWKSLMAKVLTYKDRPTRIKREGSPIPCVELYDTHGERTVNLGEELVQKGFAMWDKEAELLRTDEEVKTASL